MRKNLVEWWVEYDPGNARHAPLARPPTPD